MGTELFRLNHEEIDLVQHFRTLTPEARQAILDTVIAQSYRIEEEANVYVLATRRQA